MSDSIAALYVEIEKAAGKGMLPRGGKFTNRMDWMDSRGRRNPTGGFLTSVKQGKREYSITGKVGRNIKTGKRVAEYGNKSNRQDRRVWADVRGKTYGD